MRPFFSLSDNGFDELNQFKRLAETLVNYGKMVNCTIRPYSSSGMPFFLKLSFEKRQEVLCNMKLFVDICAETLASGKRLDDSKSLTWFGLQKLKMRFPSEMFELIGEDDVVEIYDKDNIQIFRNFQFMGLVSYTLEDFFCRPWTDLFHRPDPEKALEIIKVAQKFYNGDEHSIHSLEWMGAHRIEEVDSALKNILEAVIKSICPIYDSSKKVCGFLAIESAKILNERSDEEMGALVEKHFHESQERTPRLAVVKS